MGHFLNSTLLNISIKFWNKILIILVLKKPFFIPYELILSICFKSIFSLLSKLEGNTTVSWNLKRNLDKIKGLQTHIQKVFSSYNWIRVFLKVLMLILINGQRYNFFSCDQLHATNGWHYIFWFCTFLHIILSMENQNSRTQKRERRSHPQPSEQPFISEL